MAIVRILLDGVIHRGGVVGPRSDVVDAESASDIEEVK
jgi:hypothetical protein